MLIGIDTVQGLTDNDLLAATRRLLERDHEITADLLMHLGEIDARRLYLGRAFASMFAFCVGELGFSEDAAYNRITVARLGRRFPEVIEIVRSGRVHISGLRLLAPHITEDNHVEILSEAAGKSKRAIEEMVARLSPKPPVLTTIRRIPASPAQASEDRRCLALEGQADLLAGWPRQVGVQSRPGDAGGPAASAAAEPVRATVDPPRARDEPASPSA
jgi:hypothetical protein